MAWLASQGPERREIGRQGTRVGDMRNGMKYEGSLSHVNTHQGTSTIEGASMI